MFYVAENTAHSTVAALSMHRLIPSKLIRRVPLAASSTKIDVAALEKLIAKDIEEGLLPTLILTRAGKRTHSRNQKVKRRGLDQTQRRQ